MAKNKRRQAGEGSIFEYRLKDGAIRYGIKIYVQDGTGEIKQVLRRRSIDGKPFKTKREASKGIRELQRLAESAEGFVEPSKVLTKDYLRMWLDGLSLAPQTLESYRRLIRLHVTPYIGAIPLAKLSSTRIRSLYRELEGSGRADNRAGGLSAKTVRYVAIVLQKALKDAVRDNLLQVNPCDKVDLPNVAPGVVNEHKVWTAEQAQAFLKWTTTSNLEANQKVLFHLALATGARRGELLALRWRDIDLDAGKISIRRSLTSFRKNGKNELVEGTTKNGKSRVVDIDVRTLAMLKTHKRSRASLAFELGIGEALVFGNLEGEYLKPDSQSWAFNNAQDNLKKGMIAKAKEKGLKEVEVLPRLRFHDLRHTHATVLLKAGQHPRVVQERLGHSSVTITMETYSHVLPTMQKEAAQAVAQAIYGL